MKSDALEKLSVKDRLLFSAFQLFLQKGVDGTGIDEIVSIASVSKGALYHHFGSKDGLYDAVLERYFLRGFSQFDAAVFSDLSFEAQKTALIDGLNDMYMEMAMRYDAEKSRYFALYFDSLSRSQTFRIAVQLYYSTLLASLEAKAPAPKLAQQFLTQLEGEIYLATVFNRHPDFTSIDPRED